MGRGNTCVFGKYEGLYYIDNDYFTQYLTDDEETQIKDKHGYPVHDYELEAMNWEDDLSEFISMFTKRYPSFKKYESDRIISRDWMPVLESKLFYIAVEDNEWSMAIKLIQKEQSYYEGFNYEGLQAGLYQKYLDGMRDCLFELYPTLGVYGGAWTHGVIERPEKEITL